MHKIRFRFKVEFGASLLMGMMILCEDNKWGEVVNQVIILEFATVLFRLGDTVSAISNRIWHY